MADKDTLMKEFVDTEAAKTEDAVKDLERIEEEVVAEATMSTEFDDALGKEQAAAEALLGDAAVPACDSNPAGGDIPAGIGSAL